MAYVNTIGRRKAAIARVYLKEGTGQITINNRTPENYLCTEIQRIKLNQPFAVLGLSSGSFDLKINVDGGGVNGQTEAIRLGIARALQVYNTEYRPALKSEGLLTVDSRQVERKKYGRAKARKRFQFSKR